MSDLGSAATKQIKENIEEAIHNIADKKETKVDKRENENLSAELTQASDKIHKETDAAEGFLSDKAEIINEYAQQTIEKVNQIGQRTVEALANSSDFVRKFDISDARQQVKKTIKNKPELSIAVAGVFGLLVGLLIRRKK